MNSDNNQKMTEIDNGWRSNNDKVVKKATEIEVGWRTNELSEKRKATEIDEGWRTTEDKIIQEKVKSKHRKERNIPVRKATEIDEGWRGKSEINNRKATIIDEGWRKEIEETLNPVDIIISASSNFFAKIDDFKNAVEKLTELQSSKGIIYPIKGTISREGGESIVLLCADKEGNNVVAKVYYEPVNISGSSILSRTLVLEYMGTDEGKQYTLAVTDIGLVEFGDSKYYFEIMPYCASTDLSDDGAYSFDQIVEITRQLNQALHSIHQAGITHRDIKPENLYEFNGQYKIGDFGIAKVDDSRGERRKVTDHILGTEGYRAPEAVRYLYSSASDYYSLGVTLASLFEGHFVFENMNYEMQALAQESERLPLMRTDPNREQLENLLNGLCRINSKQRFGYKDVENWLIDHNYTGGGDGEEWPKAFRLLGDIYRDEESMFYGIAKDEEHWEEAKAMLYNKYIEQFFASFRTDLARSAQIADELYRVENRDKGLSIFLKALNPSGPIVWKGYTFKSLGILGSKMTKTKNPRGYSELLQNNCISHWINNTEGIKVNEKTLKIINSIEKLSITEPEVACYWFGNSFAPKRMLKICNRTVTSISELIESMFCSPSDFYMTDGYQKLMSRIHGADLYGFLYSFGYRKIVQKEWEHANSCDTFSKVVVLMSMLDVISEKAGVDAEPIRKFFVNYGPIGMVVYTKKLVENKIYKALDSEGKQILNRICNYNVELIGSIDELYREYIPLIESVDKLYQNLIDNPHLIFAGAYENRGVICTNLIGCFAYRIFDRMAPLGFQTWIEA